jgi:hypothetical protein
MFDSCRLVSLWDMLKFNAEKFHVLSSFLMLMESVLLSNSSRDDDSKNPEADINKINELLKTEIKPMLDEIGLRQSSKKAAAMIIQTADESVSPRLVSNSLGELRSRIKDELEDGYFLHLSGEEALFYEAVDPAFGAVVQSKFPSASFEIDEASKCLALGRDTAVVFHLMRTMKIEVGT